MFPDEVAARGATGGLSVDLGIHVVLVGLQPVYAHGLHLGLTATGQRCTIAPTSGRLARSIGAGGTVVAVLPAGCRLPDDPNSTDAGPTVELDDGTRLPAVVVHVLGEPSVQAYAAALDAGATGAFPHDAELVEVTRVVQCAGLGMTLLPVAVTRALALAQQSTDHRPELAGHDLQYLRMLAHGATIASLGRRFGHSEREMYRLLSALYQRLGVQTRTEALLLAQRYGLLDDQR